MAERTQRAASGPVLAVAGDGLSGGGEVEHLGEHLLAGFDALGQAAVEPRLEQGLLRGDHLASGRRERWQNLVGGAAQLVGWRGAVYKAIGQVGSRVHAAREDHLPGPG